MGKKKQNRNVISNWRQGSSIKIYREAAYLTLVALSAAVVALGYWYQIDSSFALVVPIVTQKLDSNLNIIRQWPSGCSLMNSGLQDLVLVANNLISNSEASLKYQVARALGRNHRCFRRILLLNANLSTSQDVYPEGPSRMFYFVVRSPLLASYKHFFWIEHDVIPIKDHWITETKNLAAHQDRFVMLGSLPLSDQIRDYIHEPAARSWLHHINGAALYSTAKDMQDLAGMAEATFGFTYPWDVSIGLVINNWYRSGDWNDWKIYLRFAPLYRYHPFILNIVGSSTLSNAPTRDQIYVHGTNTSVGYQLRASLGQLTTEP